MTQTQNSPIHLGGTSVSYDLNLWRLTRGNAEKHQAEINKNLPANVYIPIKSSTVYEFSHCLKEPLKKSKRASADDKFIMHRVLGLSVDHAFCLHSA